MFRFSNDEFIANKQKETAIVLLENLLKYFTIEHCPEIEKFFDDHVKTYEFLEELPRISEKHDDIIMMPCITHIHNEVNARIDIGDSCKKLYPSRLWKEINIPFIEFSYPQDYKCKHGDSYKHVYIFFLTKYPKFEDARDSVLYYLNKLNKLKVFL